MFSDSGSEDSSAQQSPPSCDVTADQQAGAGSDRLHFPADVLPAMLGHPADWQGLKQDGERALFI